MRYNTVVRQSVKDYAEWSDVEIVREGKIDADKLAELLDKSL